MITVVLAWFAIYMAVGLVVCLSIAGSCTSAEESYRKGSARVWSKGEEDVFLFLLWFLWPVLLLMSAHFGAIVLCQDIRRLWAERAEDKRLVKEAAERAAKCHIPAFSTPNPYCRCDECLHGMKQIRG